MATRQQTTTAEVFLIFARYEKDSSTKVNLDYLASATGCTAKAVSHHIAKARKIMNDEEGESKFATPAARKRGPNTKRKNDDNGQSEGEGGDDVAPPAKKAKTMSKGAKKAVEAAGKDGSANGGRAVKEEQID